RLDPLESHDSRVARDLQPALAQRGQHRAAGHEGDRLSGLCQSRAEIGAHGPGAHHQRAHPALVHAFRYSKECPRARRRAHPSRGPSMPAQLPTRSPILVAFAMGIALLIALVQLDFIEFAYERVGIAPQYVFAILVASLLGSYINFPIALLPDRDGSD